MNDPYVNCEIRWIDGNCVLRFDVIGINDEAKAKALGVLLHTGLDAIAKRFADADGEISFRPEKLLKRK